MKHLLIIPGILVLIFGAVGVSAESSGIRYEPPPMLKETKMDPPHIINHKMENQTKYPKMKNMVDYDRREPPSMTTYNRHPLFPSLVKGSQTETIEIAYSSEERKDINPDKKSIDCAKIEDVKGSKITCRKTKTDKYGFLEECTVTYFQHDPDNMITRCTKFVKKPVNFQNLLTDLNGSENKENQDALRALAVISDWDKYEYELIEALVNLADRNTESYVSKKIIFIFSRHIDDAGEDTLKHYEDLEVSERMSYIYECRLPKNKNVFRNMLKIGIQKVSCKR